MIELGKLRDKRKSVQPIGVLDTEESGAVPKLSTANLKNMGRDKQKYTQFKYSEENLALALAAVKSGSMKLSDAARRFDVPKSTIHNKIKEKVPNIRKMGPAPVLSTAEEDRLQNWILSKAKLGFPMHPKKADQIDESVWKEHMHLAKTRRRSQKRPKNLRLRLRLRRLKLKVLKKGSPSGGYNIGDYVVVNYEGANYPGLIKNVRNTEYEISVLHKTTKNRWKWPTPADQIWYQAEEVVKQISWHQQLVPGGHVVNM
ncbi:hypothetical protein NQ314_019886 [Rhamnusium bicolor]|uniref:HTH psq-type domain-containing protein n=1 Tax=Rhamnusium bicolor TaxID=1586634 RepID=A0AAV8WLH9_9CUCU|nr:hypothetical protein NQ314_019886 [Rhamnusium bicolor]